MEQARRAVAVIFLSLAGAALAPGAALAQDGAVSGTVTDTTGLVLPGVSVEARAAPGGPVLTAATDGAGQFAIGGLEAGAWELTFTLPGFQTVVRTAAVGAGAAATLDVEMAVELAERVVVLGSRAQPRSVTESQVPIDAIPFEDVMSQGATTLDYQLRNLIPSFNVATHPISDAATLVRPASLRNLSHDHTLILVNGKRRHRSSVIAWFGGVTDGAQGPDISTIPSIALRQVEVLRDGASAQYGSDAIAGVINFLLKDDPSGGSLELNTGTYRPGDGDAYSFAGNAGLPLGETGFANLSLEYGNANPTDRSVQRLDAAALAAAGNTLAPAGGPRGRSVPTRRRASSPPRTASPASPTTPPARGPATTSPPTATSSCGGPTTGGARAPPSASSTSTSSATPPTASCRSATRSTTPSRCAAASAPGSGPRRRASRTP